MAAAAMIGGRVVARGVVWRAAEVVGSEGLAFLSFVVLARLLLPEAFGLVSQATLLMLAAQLVLQQGLPEALVQQQGVAAAHFDTAFWANLILGGLIAAALLASAPLLARLLAEPALPAVLAALAPALVVVAASRVVLAKLRREFRFQGFALLSIAATLAGAGIGIVMAVAGFGVWSLVAQQWGYALTCLVIGWWYSRWLPRPRLAWQHLAQFWPFSRWTVLEALLAFCARRLDLLILAAFWSAVEVGHYFLAHRLLLAAGMLTYYSVSHLALPILARLAADPAAHHAAIYWTFRLVSLACLPALVGLGLIAPQLIPLLFGEAWLGSVLPFQLLSLLSIFYALTLVAGQALLSAGHARDALLLSVANLVLFLLAVSLAAPHGIAAAALAGGIANLLTLPLALKTLERRFGLEGRRLLREQGPAWLATAVMAGAVLACQEILAAWWPPAGVLAAAIAVGAGSFLATFALAAPREWRDILASFHELRQPAPD